MSEIKEELFKAYNCIKEGGVILYPTDTIWGLGCDATNEEAVQKIFAIKQRPVNKSLIVLLDDEIKLNKYLKEVPAVAWDLVENAVSPLTIIYPDACGVAKSAMNEDGSIAIRITKDEFCRSLIQKMGRPLISTSANISGEQTDGTFSSIAPVILSNVDYIVNLRRNEKQVGPASTIIRLALNGEFNIIRK